MFSKFVAINFLFLTSIALGVAIMVYGWGLEPQSWWWIIGGGIGGRILVELILAITKQEK